MSFKKLYSAPWKPEDFRKIMKKLKDQGEDDGFNKKELESKKPNEKKYFPRSFDNIN